ncbi:MAG: YceI family protein [Hyphomicrobiales bacterium]
MGRWIRILATTGLLAAAGLIAATAAPAAQFTVRPGAGNKVVFTSKAPLETFQGKTDRIEGEITADPEDLGDSATVRLEVDLASLDTGIDKRNQHMREKHLETDKYPRAIFTGVVIRGPNPARLAPGKEVPLDVEGTFSLHGVERRIHPAVSVTLLEGPGPPRLRIHATFPVSLADYGITRPEFLFLKLSDTQDVEVEAVASSAGNQRSAGAGAARAEEAMPAAAAAARAAGAAAGQSDAR